MELARKEQESRDPTEHTRIAFLIGKSDEKVQALTVLMLHFCAGLQHTQDQEEILKVMSRLETRWQHCFDHCCGDHEGYHLIY
jgi:hypothetical protein